MEFSLKNNEAGTMTDSTLFEGIVVEGSLSTLSIVEKISAKIAVLQFPLDKVGGVLGVEIEKLFS